MTENNKKTSGKNRKKYTTVDSEKASEATDDTNNEDA